MKKRMKRVTAKVVAVAMVMMTVAGIGRGPAKSAKAAELSSYLNMEYGIKYTGQTDAKKNSEANAWSIEYFNVADSAYAEGDVFYFSGKISGASNFKQVAIQSSVNNWNWDAAPKKWTDAGTADDTVVAGKVVATQNGDKISFKIQFDNVVDEAKASDTEKITLTDLYIMKVSKASQTAAELPEDKQLDLGTKYTGTVAAAVNEGVYEAQYFNVNDSSYSKGDTYIISYTLGGATQFKQVATQTNLNDWSWPDAKKVWATDGLAESQDVSGDFVAASAGNEISFKVRLDTPVDASAELGDSINLTLTDLVVVKVANNDTIALPESKMLNKGRSYSGAVKAEKDGDNWNVQYFNVNDSKFTKDSQIKISFKISGADVFKQLVVQSNLNNWAWDSAPKIWRSEGIEDGTTVSAVITATETSLDNIAFKLWLDNPVDSAFDKASVDMTLTDLKVTDVQPVESLDAAYKDHFNVGAAVSDSMVGNSEYQNRIKGVFGTITAENEMKPDALLNKAACQSEGNVDPVLNLDNSGMSRILDFAKNNGLKVRGHALLYPAQTPDWFFHENYADNGALVNATVMRARMKSYIKQVVEYADTNYPGVVTCWDVVNEALDNDGKYVANNWTATVGENYVAKAFEFADQYASADTKLYYNDYNMENSGKQNVIVTLSRNLKMDEIRFDGIGMQEHITLSYPAISDIGAAIDSYAGEGLDVQITELDVQIEADETLNAQADRYEALFTLFKSKSAKISNVTLWGINDGNSWKSSKRPLLFYDDLTPKPAYDSVLRVAKTNS